MNKEQKILQDIEPNIAVDSVLYTVSVICWDDTEYTREATKDEIDTQRNNGYVKGDGYSGITFDFRSSHGI